MISHCINISRQAPPAPPKKKHPPTRIRLIQVHRTSRPSKPARASPPLCARSGSAAASAQSRSSRRRQQKHRLFQFRGIRHVKGPLRRSVNYAGRPPAPSPKQAAERDRACRVGPPRKNSARPPQYPGGGPVLAAREAGHKGAGRRKSAHKRAAAPGPGR